MNYRERTTLWLLAALAVLVLGTGLAVAQTAQTIVIDGVNDFLPGNLVDADGLDTQFTEIDLGDIYITNDAVNFYLGFQTGPGSFGTNQLGFAIDVGTAAGGSVDPWGRAIEWSTAANKPDFMFYVNLDNNWQASYQWDGAVWQPVASGPGSLGWATGTEFRELAVMLGSLGVSPGSIVNWELWFTQDSPTKGPLDCAANDGLQLSVPGFTLWDTATPIPLTDYHAHTVLAAADPDPPTVVQVQPTSFPVDSFFDVYFNEPVDAATANVPGNYALTGATVTGAARDAGDPSIVHLTLAAPIGGSAGLYTLTVTNVEDLAGNPIVADGVGNTSCFGLKDVVFRGKFGPMLDNTAEVPPYQFSVEGDKAPLTFDPVCDTGMMTDTLVDDIWEYSTTMLYAGDCVGGTASESFEWKFNFQCGIWEPLAGNRTHTLDLVNGAVDTLEFWWNDEDPSQFTLHDIDVLFFVNMNNTAIVPGDTVSINGSVAPLSFDVPSLNELVDDGSGVDDTAGDGIFSTVITFPAGSNKDVAYKFLLNSAYECEGLGDRDVFLNDELFDTIGGTLGPLTLPTVNFDFCNAIWRAVEVVFQVDFNNTAWENIDEFFQIDDVVGVNGTANNAEPPTFDWTIPSLNEMLDDGVAPDLVAGDKIYTVSVIFPDTSAQNVDYKYLVNGEYEGSTVGNRYFAIDPDNYDAVGNPQILPVDVYQSLGLSPVPERGLAGLLLEQNNPNPFNPSTKIRFNVAREGTGSLRIYNVRGELVRDLRSGKFETGPGVIVWDGRTDSGRAVGSGVYFYRLAVGAEAVTKRMVLLK
ncbi:MAG: choice-of-anchor X domain-containing protein [Candidatus Krumholzibacteriota bacterium]